MEEINQKGFAAIVVALVITAALLAGAGVWVYQTQVATPKPAPAVQKTENQSVVGEKEVKTEVEESEEPVKTEIAIQDEILTEKEIAWHEYLKKTIENYDSKDWNVRRSEKFGYEIKLPVDWSGTEYSYYNDIRDNQINIAASFIENFDLFLDEKIKSKKIGNSNIENIEKKEINGLPVAVIESKNDDGGALYYYFKLPVTIHASSQKHKYNVFIVDFETFIHGWELDPDEKDLISLIMSSFKVNKISETQADKQMNELYNASVCISQPYPRSNLDLADGEAGYEYNFFENEEPVDYVATLDVEKFLVADVDNDGNNESVVFITEFDKLSHIYPKYMQILEKQNEKWICPGKENTILLDGYGLEIKSVLFDGGFIKITRDTDFDRQNMTSRTVEEIYKLENGKLIKKEEKTIKYN
ncbi:MAG TPA: hypothetical protein PLA19_00715 [Candidatus Pacearchaeota archaeon]|nr:hypothetical protein [Candidatus Pacearchaeota archaeon]